MVETALSLCENHEGARHPLPSPTNTRDYMLVCARGRSANKKGNFKLAEDPEAAAAEFLTTLAKYGAGGIPAG